MVSFRCKQLCLLPSRTTFVATMTQIQGLAINSEQRVILSRAVKSREHDELLLARYLNCVRSNHHLAVTMRLALDTNSRVRVRFNEANNNTMSQARIQFEYCCERRKVMKCNRGSPKPTNDEICELRRITPCEPNDVPDVSRA